jgi:sulfatase maturation enzyme AslB (radical SAM superfamily)
MQDYLAGDQGCFEETVQGIKNIKSLGVKVRTNTVVCKQNYKELKDIVEYSMDLGTDHINISGIHPTGKAYKNFHNVTPMYTDIIPYVKEAVDAAVKENKVVTLKVFHLVCLANMKSTLLTGMKSNTSSCSTISSFQIMTLIWKRKPVNRVQYVKTATRTRMRRRI